eukprot:TRINITY_DN1748_c0_g1_i2.p1 TRINITY_DN1748_c0_g1~~TRINITY_DN1748_c0_g1_i2.p1  ORF type:complete len:356 (+),score=83.22 TRINITY_DN1748_c0_g1_i2:173-1240(+)
MNVDDNGMEGDDDADDGDDESDIHSANLAPFADTFQLGDFGHDTSFNKRGRARRSHNTMSSFSYGSTGSGSHHNTGVGSIARSTFQSGAALNFGNSHTNMSQSSSSRNSRPFSQDNQLSYSSGGGGGRESMELTETIPEEPRQAYQYTKGLTCEIFMDGQWQKGVVAVIKHDFVTVFVANSAASTGGTTSRTKTVSNTSDEIRPDPDGRRTRRGGHISDSSPGSGGPLHSSSSSTLPSSDHQLRDIVLDTPPKTPSDDASQENDRPPVSDDYMDNRNFPEGENNFQHPIVMETRELGPVSDEQQQEQEQEEDEDSPIVDDMDETQREDENEEEEVPLQEEFQQIIFTLRGRNSTM